MFCARSRTFAWSLLLATCITTASSPSWAAGSDGRLRSNGLCATVASGGAGSGPEIFATSCGNVPEQKWRLYEP